MIIIIIIERERKEKHTSTIYVFLSFNSQTSNFFFSCIKPYTLLCDCFYTFLSTYLLLLMHYMDSNKTAGEEARRQLHKNAASNLEQVLTATPHKTPTVRPPASYHENYSDMQDTAGEAGTNS